MVQVLKTSATHGTAQRGANVEEPTHQKATRSSTEPSAMQGTERRGAKSKPKLEEPTQQEASRNSKERVAPASAGKANRQNASII
jgi:hypothetical protein